MLATLGAPERRRLLAGRRRTVDAEPEPEPAPVTTGRATVIDVGDPLPGQDEAEQWLPGRGRGQLVRRARGPQPRPARLPAGHRRPLPGAGRPPGRPWWPGSASAPASRSPTGCGRRRASCSSIAPRQRRAKVLQPQARLAAVLGGRERPLACEELALRARLDLEHGRQREAALQLLVALDAAMAELSADPTAAAPGRAPRRSCADSASRWRQAAQAALSGSLAASEHGDGRVHAGADRGRPASPRGG